MSIDIDLHRLAVVYMQAIHAGGHPTPVIAAEFGIARATVARRVNDARAAGLLPPGAKGCATPADGDHWPRIAIFSNGKGRWKCCMICRLPWPCPGAATVKWLQRLEETAQ